LRSTLNASKYEFLRRKRNREKGKKETWNVM